MSTQRPFARHPVTLLDVASGTPVDAELWEAITDDNLGDWEAEWVPALFELLKALNRQGVERRLWPQSRHWDWRDKLAEIEGRLANRCHAIVQDGMTQAMMIVDLTKRARIAGQLGQHLVYVDFLETAPWNRHDLTRAMPQLAGCGSILVATAIELSIEEGFKGRIGLHSLPQSNDFYSNRCGMQDLGVDAHFQNLRYFEATPEIAQQFIEKGKEP